MKGLGYIILFLIIFAAGLFAGLYLAGHSPDEVVKLVEEKTRGVVVNFADENRESAVREALSNPPGEAITSVELARFWWLDASRRGITNLSGIEYCSGLTALYLYDNQISDISYLASLNKLVHLHLRDNQISDLSPLVDNSGLGEGDRLWLDNNNLDLSEGLVDLENIRQLERRGVTVTLKPAEFRLSSLVVTPREVILGDKATATVDVRNIGELEGDYDCALLIGGVTVQREEVTLHGGEAKTVSFTFTPEELGSCQVTVGDLTQTIKVLKTAEFTTFSKYGFSFEYPKKFSVTEMGLMQREANDTSGMVQVGVENEEIQMFQVMWIQIVQSTWKVSGDLEQMLIDSFAGMETAEDVAIVERGESVDTTKAGHQMFYQYYTMTSTEGDRAHGIVAVFYCDESEAVYQLITINNTITAKQAVLEDFQTYLDSFVCH